MHCWKDYKEWLEEKGKSEPTTNKTCLLRDGHKGSHRWTDDDDIIIFLKGGIHANPSRNN
jgi:hypothetical protein